MEGRISMIEKELFSIVFIFLLKTSYLIFLQTLNLQIVKLFRKCNNLNCADYIKCHMKGYRGDKRPLSFIDPA